MQNDELLKPTEVAKMLNITIGTLANWRLRDRKLNFTFTGYLKWIELPNGSIRYKKLDVINWIASREQ